MTDSSDHENDTLEAIPTGEGGEHIFGHWLAEVWDEEIEPLFGQRFSEPLLARLELPERAQVLVAGCSTGMIIPAVLERLEAVGQGRVIALEANGYLLEKARSRVAELDRRRVFLKGESMRKLRFADGVFGVVVSSLSWMDLPEPEVAIKEFYRVLEPGGSVALALPLRGTLQEIYDLFAEVALKYDLPEVQRSLEHQIKRRHPQPDDARRLLAEVEFENIDLYSEEYSLSFSSGVAFFESVFFKGLFEPQWRRIAGDTSDTLFDRTREAIDKYFVGDSISIRLVVGCLFGTKPRC